MAMKTPTSKHKATRFDIPFDGNPDFDLSLGVYVFNRAGDLIEQFPARGKKGQTFLTPKELRHTRMFIAPLAPEEDTKERITLASMERRSAYEAVMNFGREGIELLPVPDFHWKFWLWKPCRVRGKVVKELDVNGSPVPFPVCCVRVHICEVDRIWFLLPRIPDRVILDLRDKLLEIPALQRVPQPPIPILDPPPFRFDVPVFDQKNGFRDGNENDASVAMISTHINRQISSQEISANLQELKLGLISNHAHELRNTIGNYFHLIHPYLCYWPNFWPHFYTCDEMRVVKTDSQGRFDTTIWYQCFSDKPDLYFWVEAVIGGTWTTVYRPNIPCNTYWNYACGREVTIKVQDERVDACGELPTPAGLIARIEKIGSAAYIPTIQQSNTTVMKQNQPFRQIGLTDIWSASDDYRRPFGGTLAPRVYFGSDLRTSGITHYRWRYRKVQDANGAPVIGSPTNTIDAPVSIPYYEEKDGLAYKKWFKLGPVDDVSEPIFHIPPRLAEDLEDAAFGLANPDNLTRTWSMQEFATALWNTTQLGSAEDSAGLYELSFELIRIVAGAVEVVDVPKSAFQIPEAADYNDTEAAPDNYLIPEPGDATRAQGFKLFVRIDNNPCEAVIYPAEVDGVAQGDECGFLGYDNAADPVKLSFKAAHANDFATFGFFVRKGVTHTVPAANTGGMVIGSTFEADGVTVDYALASETYSKTLTAATMVGMCKNAAYAEVLNVDALATNGSVRLSGLDRDAVAAFALEDVS